MKTKYFRVFKPNCQKQKGDEPISCTMILVCVTNNPAAICKNKKSYVFQDIDTGYLYAAEDSSIH